MENFFGLFWHPESSACWHHIHGVQIPESQLGITGLDLALPDRANACKSGKKT